MLILLDIAAQVLCQPNQYAVIQNPTKAAEIADTLLETILLTWVRSGIREDGIWITLRDTMKQCTRWKECVMQWEVSECSESQRSFVALLT